MDILSFFVIFSISFFSFFLFMILKRVSDSYKIYKEQKSLEDKELGVYNDHNE